MVFVPVPMPPSRPSRQTEELARRLEETIDAYQREFPSLSRAEIQHALQLAKGKDKPEVAPAKAAAIVGGLVAALLAGMVAFQFAGGGGKLDLPSLGGMSATALIVGVGVLTVLIALARIRFRGD